MQNGEAECQHLFGDGKMAKVEQMGTGWAGCGRVVVLSKRDAGDTILRDERDGGWEF